MLLCYAFRVRVRVSSMLYALYFPMPYCAMIYILTLLSPNRRERLPLPMKQEAEMFLDFSSSRKRKMIKSVTMRARWYVQQNEMNDSFWFLIGVDC